MVLWVAQDEVLRPQPSRRDAESAGRTGAAATLAVRRHVRRGSLVMPTWTVQVRINVPTVGEARPVFTGIVAATIEAAIAQAKQGFIVETLAAQKTADTP